MNMNNYQKKFNDFLTSNLNQEQLKAVKQSQGSLLVIAGAGSGKTRVITARIAHLILNEQVNPASIVALTFTNKAATEMAERIEHFLGPDIPKPFIGTFHGYCLRLLKSNIKLLNITTFSILDADDQHKIINGIITRNNLGKRTTAQQLLYYISQLKNQLIAPDQAASAMTNITWIKQVYTAYEAEKKASNCFDFDDLLIETLTLFKKHAPFKQALQEQIRHILVDEYQDTNVVQHELLKQMATSKTLCSLDSLCAVGDEDQSIYSWRGATVANMLNFKKDFAPTTLIKLEQNYRSAQPILEVANKVITHNKYRNPKTLWSGRDAHDRIRSIICLSDYQESDAIAQFIHLASARQKRSSIAILYRTHSQSRSLEEGLLKSSIPYKIIGGIQFYERKEIKDLLAYLRLIANPFDRPAFFRVINCPSRSLGEKFEALFQERWQQEPHATFGDIATMLINDGSITGIKKTALTQFLHIFSGLTHASAVSTALQTIITAIDYQQYLNKTYDAQEAQDRWDNVQELINAVHHVQTIANTVELFLHDVALMQEKKKADDTESDPVFLMTLHAAKGLEFNTIIIAGLEEGLLPSSRSLNDTNALEEERRLLYVGITRAQERLLITRTRYRYLYGKMTDQLPSRFMAEFPKDLVTTQDISSVTQQQLGTWLSQWISGALGAPQVPPAKPESRKKIVPKATIATPADKSASKESGRWKKHQPVMHPTFGMGIIQEVEKRSDSTFFLEIKFKSGVKKISHQFVKPM